MRDAIWPFRSTVGVGGDDVRLAISFTGRLQRKQVTHDAIYHSDIANMPPIGKLTHYNLHMVKYLGPLLAADTAERKRALIDAVVISLSALNALQTDPRTVIGDGQPNRSSTFGGLAPKPQGIYADVCQRNMHQATARGSGPTRINDIHVDKFYEYMGYRHPASIQNYVDLVGDLASDLNNLTSLKSGNWVLNLCIGYAALYWSAVDSLQEIIGIENVERAVSERLTQVELKQPNLVKRHGTHEGNYEPEE